MKKLFFLVVLGLLTLLPLVAHAQAPTVQSVDPFHFGLGALSGWQAGRGMLERTRRLASRWGLYLQKGVPTATFAAAGADVELKNPTAASSFTTLSFRDLRSSLERAPIRSCERLLQQRGAPLVESSSRTLGHRPASSGVRSATRPRMRRPGGGRSTSRLGPSPSTGATIRTQLDLHRDGRRNRRGAWQRGGRRHHHQHPGVQKAIAHAHVRGPA